MKQVLLNPWCAIQIVHHCVSRKGNAVKSVRDSVNTCKNLTGSVQLAGNARQSRRLLADLNYRPLAMICLSQNEAVVNRRAKVGVRPILFGPAARHDLLLRKSARRIGFDAEFEGEPSVGARFRPEALRVLDKLTQAKLLGKNGRPDNGPAESSQSRPTQASPASLFRINGKAVEHAIERGSAFNADKAQKWALLHTDSQLLPVSRALWRRLVQISC